MGSPYESIILFTLKLGNISENFLANNHSVREIKREPRSHERGECKKTQKFSEYFMVTLFCFFACHKILVQIFFGGKCESVNSGKHGILFVATPICPCDAVQLKRVGLYRFWIFHMAATTEVCERSGCVERKCFSFLRKLINQLNFIRIFLKMFSRVRDGHFFALKSIPCGKNLTHFFFDCGKIRVGNRCGKFEVIIKSVVD